MIKTFIEELVDYPWAFWVAFVIVAALVLEAAARWNSPWAKPALIVYATVATWYLGDLVYTGLDDFTFPGWLIESSLLQVCLFLLAFRGLLSLIVPRFTRGVKAAGEQADIDPRSLTLLLGGVTVVWLPLLITGLELAEWQVVDILWPVRAKEKVGMFVHPGVGSGSAFLLAAAGYIYVFVCSAFGVIFVMARGWGVRGVAFALIAISWPYFWFDRTRNVMLAILLPAVFCFCVFGRVNWKAKLGVLALLFGFVNLWFQSVALYRGGDLAVGELIERSQEGDAKHQGLDMLKELCWINYFVQAGEYAPNMGQRYIADIANVIPRTFWPEKPMIGIDYAILRGQGGNEENEAGVFGTVSTGMLGQGIASFGPVFGVLAPAVLMAAWAGLLSRLWLQRARLPRLLLFIVGCGLTFNMGRDITLLVLWPFVFGYIGVRIAEVVRQFYSVRSVEATRLRVAVCPVDDRTHEAGPGTRP
jgi:hypothetical protein